MKFYGCNKLLPQYVANLVTYVALLNELTSIKRVFKWTQVKQDALDKIKCIVGRDTLLTYQDFNETFKIHTNASTFQLGLVISHKGKPIAFYGRTLTDSQQWYTVTEREILIIEENPKGI